MRHDQHDPRRCTHRVRALSTSLLVLLSLAAAWFPRPALAEGLSILAATNDLGAIARAVAGDDADIRVVARPDRDPHSVEVRPSMMTMAAKADVYLSVGLSLDAWSAGIVQGSRNTNLSVIDCSSAIVPLEVPAGKVDASMGDVHPFGNPHYWLDPENAKLLATFLAKRFGALDAAHAATYETNAERFGAKISERLPAWEASLRGKSFIEYHRTWAYAAARFGLTIADRVEPLPGIPPTAQHLAKLAALIRERDLPLVVRDVYHPAQPVAFLARETGVDTVVLSASAKEATLEAYFAIFDELASALQKAS